MGFTLARLGGGVSCETAWPLTPGRATALNAAMFGNTYAGIVNGCPSGAENDVSFSVTVPPGQAVSVVVTPQGFDATVSLLGDSAACNSRTCVLGVNSAAEGPRRLPPPKGGATGPPAMNTRSLTSCAVLLLVPLLGCGPSQAVVAADLTDDAASQPLLLQGCAGVPADFDGRQVARFIDEQASTTVYLAPAHPRPGQAVFALLSGAAGLSATARHTENGWASFTDTGLARWCTLGSGATVWGARLGSFARGTAIELAVRVDLGAPPVSQWRNNHGQNYRAQVDDGPALVWLGDAELRYADRALPQGLLPAHHALQVYAQSYPMGAAAEVKLFWLSDGDGQLRSVAMELVGEHAGPFGANSQWAGSFDAAELLPGRPVRYWVRAQDELGHVLWDSRGGANYTLVPAKLEVGWVGGFGAYRPTADSYTEGHLFEGDGATATGCDNHGASISSYSTRAVRLYLPGLTDRRYASADARNAAARLVRAEVRTDATAQGWASVPMSLATQVGNDFVYGFFPFNLFCSPGADQGQGLADGRYGYRVRFSTDEGRSWFERGAAGGGELPLQYGATCSYFGDPYDCHPASATYYTYDYSGGAAGQGGAVVRWQAVAPGGAATDWRVVRNRGSAAVSLARLALTGTDRALFSFTMSDADTGAAMSPAAPFTLAPGKGVRLSFTFRPVAASGALPLLASLDWFDDAAQPAGPSHQPLVFLRGTTP